MTNNIEPTVIEDNLVVTMEYSLTVDSELVDSADKSDPIEFIQGLGTVIPGLERELYGMKIGESKEVTVSPAEGYGEYDAEAIVEITRAEFPPEIPLEPGTEITVTDDDGEILEARIVKVDDTNITIDMNHPLAGKTLKFNVKIVALREATAEEIEHEHVHGDDMDYDEDFDEDVEEEENK
ncbi:MAG: peptidylprolyl isomerase [Anaerolineaceae bacterium]|nr:peptidylprolyl isomerase [Anaerolineaceae bacterium]NTV35941.1 peptidylprolyl isomerase [Anaerolineaceae bacterium]